MKTLESENTFWYTHTVFDKKTGRNLHLQVRLHLDNKFNSIVKLSFLKDRCPFCQKKRTTGEHYKTADCRKNNFVVEQYLEFTSAA